MTIYLYHSRHKVHLATGIFISLAIMIGFHRRNRGTGTILTSPSQDTAMRIMVRAEEIMELVGIDILIHRNREDILLRCLIMRREIE